MRAWRVRELGDPEEALKLEEVEDPSPGPGEVVPFEEVPRALMLLGSRSSRGKIVTRPGV